MSKLLSFLLIALCALNGWAQSPLLKSHWTQNHPYNQFCPADPLENYAHSYAGCPAVAMGQIINYLQTTQNTRFDDGDDYYSSYAGRNFHIDDDWAAYSFPSFPQLNEMLDSVDATFQRHEELSGELAAGTARHNVVVDGYRESNGKFHMNFGYGGSQDNWYDIPDPNFFYGLTKLEGIILNIIPVSDTLAVHETALQQQLEVYPNPASDMFYLKNLPCETVKYSIFNVLGQEVTTGTTSGSISVAGLQNGVYFLQIKGDGLLETRKFVVK